MIYPVRPFYAQGSPFIQVAPLTSRHAKPAQDQVRFSGKKERLNPANKALLQKLKDAGVSRQSLALEWGVLLWTLRQNGSTVRAKVDVINKKKYDEKAFAAFLLDKLGDKSNGIRQVNLYEKPVKKCCDKPCEGCLRGNKSTKKEWTA